MSVARAEAAVEIGVIVCKFPSTFAGIVGTLRFVWLIVPDLWSITSVVVVLSTNDGSCSEAFV